MERRSKEEQWAKRKLVKDIAEEVWRQGNEGTDIVLKYIYQYKKEFQLIFCHSAGTEYEAYFDKLAAIEEEYYRTFARQYIYEILTHDKTYEEATAYMKAVRVFNFAGWRALLGFESI